MDKIGIAKKVVSLVVGVGISKIVSDTIKNNVHPDKVTEKVTVIAGSVVLGGIIADASKKYTDQKIDELVTWWNDNIKPKFE